MKVSAFHLMPHRELPQDFERRYDSVRDYLHAAGVDPATVDKVRARLLE